MISKRLLLGVVVTVNLMIGQNVYGMHYKIEDEYRPQQTIEVFLKTDAINYTSNNRKGIIIELYKNFVAGFHEMLSEKEYIRLDEAYTKENMEIITNQNIETLYKLNLKEIKKSFKKIQIILNKVHLNNITNNNDAKTYFLKQAFDVIMLGFTKSRLDEINERGLRCTTKRSIRSLFEWNLVDHSRYE